MDSALADILDVCLVRLEAGTSVDDCLSEHPRQRAELEAPLLIAATLANLPRPAMPAATRAALESQVLARAAARRAAQAQPAPAANGVARPALGPAALLAGVLRAFDYHVSPARPWMRLASVVVALVLALALGVGTFAAARSIIHTIVPQRPAPAPTIAPTDAPTSAPTGAQTLKPFTLDGAIAGIDQEGWVVGAQPVAIDERTTISGVPIVGAHAHVEGSILADGSLLARAIAVAAPTQAPSLTPVPPSPTDAPPSPTDAPPALTPTPAPQPAPAPSQGGSGDDKQHTCRGQEKGKDEKKCDPKRPDPKDDKGNRRGRKG